jgi:colanic acid/amylovoran biosynthesis glycosyltransferase
MKNSDIFLAPSVTSESGDQEGIPVVLMEAMASQMPVISSYHSGIPELVISGENGLLVKERDTYELAKKIEFLLDNPNIARRYGSKGKRFVEKNHNIKILNEKLIQIYENL